MVPGFQKAESQHAFSMGKIMDSLVNTSLLDGPWWAMMGVKFSA